VTALDLAIVIVLGFAAYSGFKRGAVYMGLELTSFLIATAVALLAYRPLGALLRHLTHTSTAFANVAAFTVAWVATGLICALLARLWLGRHITKGVPLSRAHRIGGAVLGVARAAVVLALAVLVVSGLPAGSNAKRVVTDSGFGKVSLAYTGQLQSWLAGGLGHDLGESLNFFTVTANPEGLETIELGYKTSSGTVDPAGEAAMLVMLNHERTTRGLQALTLNTAARKVARAHSADMFARGYFSHVTPEGKSPFDRLRAGGVDFGAGGENLALAPTLSLAHQGLMNSPGHRANILSTQYKAVGIGIVDGGPYGLMVTQDFTE
jgi:uncharacterized membrane protein required for colicin V production